MQLNTSPSSFVANSRPADHNQSYCDQIASIGRPSTSVSHRSVFHLTGYRRCLSAKWQFDPAKDCWRFRTGPVWFIPVICGTVLVILFFSLLLWYLVRLEPLSNREYHASNLLLYTGMLLMTVFGCVMFIRTFFVHLNTFCIECYSDGSLHYTVCSPVRQNHLKACYKNDVCLLVAALRFPSPLRDVYFRRYGLFLVGQSQLLRGPLNNPPFSEPRRNRPPPSRV